jgi:hypothetical protein
MTSDRRFPFNSSANRDPGINNIKARIISALVDLYRYDYELFDSQANERSITHKLAEYLQRNFPSWHVDCEYNRRENQTKKIGRKRVFPDIIVHKRRTGDNLLVIEVKKGESNYEVDVKKIRKFLSSPQYFYRYGLFLSLNREGCKRALFIRNNSDDIDWSQEIQRHVVRLGAW